MGMYDSVVVPCNYCKEDIVEFQSKAGPCDLKIYPLCEVPLSVAEDIDGETSRCRSCQAEMTIRIPSSVPKFVMMVAE